MKIVRTIVLVLLLVALAVFSYYNWFPVDVRIWEGLIWETRIPVLVIIAFLAGLLPMWLTHLAARWRMRRRMAALEAAARHNVAVAEPLPPLPLPPEPNGPEPNVPDPEAPEPDTRPLARREPLEP